MRISQILSHSLWQTLREAPADAEIASHTLSMRAGLLSKLANGLYTYMPMGLRSFRKVEAIIREELDDAGLLEIKPTVIVPGALWKQSGRWETMGDEMLRVKTRGGQDMVVSPTAEEAFTFLMGASLKSYKQLPVTIYQINTKYRDEIRPRYGVMRGREFTMMDAYSFNADEASLDSDYQKISKAYCRIFRRAGLSIINVKADTGAMGGSGSEEFMVESTVGDDTLILCPNKDCGYASNVEKASCMSDDVRLPHCTVPDGQAGGIPCLLPSNAASDGQQTSASEDGKSKTPCCTPPIEKVSCPGVETIAQMQTFFQMSAAQFIKVLIYKVSNCALDLTGAPGIEAFKRETTASGEMYYPECFIAVAIRGDLEVNEAKCAAALRASGVELANEEDVIKYSGAPHGFVGPVGLKKVPLLADDSVMSKTDGRCIVRVHDAVTGGGVKDTDMKHVEPVRDFMPFITADVRTVKAGDRCPQCGAALYTKKGNELGHIFKLGTKYTHSMNITYLDAAGKPQVPLMGCYGIGVDRTLASIIEEHHDDKGIIWPMSTAPFHAVIVPAKYEGETKKTCDNLYRALTNRGVEVLLDDRKERPGVKFADMDLLGIPIRIIAGKTMPNVEVSTRRAGNPKVMSTEEAAAAVADMVQKELSSLSGEAKTLLV